MFGDGLFKAVHGSDEMSTLGRLEPHLDCVEWKFYQFASSTCDLDTRHGQAMDQDWKPSSLTEPTAISEAASRNLLLFEGELALSGLTCGSTTVGF